MLHSGSLVSSPDQHSAVSKREQKPDLQWNIHIIKHKCMKLVTRDYMDSSYSSEVILGFLEVIYI